jgi:hypothetical protein
MSDQIFVFKFTKKFYPIVVTCIRTIGNYNIKYRRNLPDKHIRYIKNAKDLYIIHEWKDIDENTWRIPIFEYNGVEYAIIIQNTSYNSDDIDNVKIPEINIIYNSTYVVPNVCEGPLALIKIDPNKNICDTLDNMIIINNYYMNGNNIHIVNGVSSICYVYSRLYNIEYIFNTEHKFVRIYSNEIINKNFAKYIYTIDELLRIKPLSDIYILIEEYNKSNLPKINVYYENNNMRIISEKDSDIIRSNREMPKYSTHKDLMNDILLFMDLWRASHLFYYSHIATS